MRFTKYLAVVGIVLFLFILYSVGPLQVFKSLAALDPFLLAVALLLFPPVLLLKGWKQQVLLSGLRAKVGLLESTKIWLIGFFYAMITPAKAGDFFRVLYLKQSIKISLGTGTSALAVERIFDLGFLFIAGFIGLILFSSEFFLDSSIFLALAVFLVVFLAAVFALTKKKWVSFLLKPLFKVLLPARFRQGTKKNFNEFFTGISQLILAKRVLLVVVFLTIASWLLNFLQYYLLVLALGLPLSLEFFFWVIPIIFLIEILPISFSGIGTRDATAIFFFSFAGITAGQAVSFSLSILFLTILTGLLGLFFLRGREFSGLGKNSKTFKIL